MKLLIIIILAFIVILYEFFLVNASEDTVTNGKPYRVRIEQTKTKMSGSFAEFEIKNGIDQSSEIKGSCYYRYRYYYYTPYVYYRPVYYTTCCYTSYTYYRCQYIIYYNGTVSNEANGEKGIMMNQTPDAKSPLGMQALKKGDIITHIDGKKVRSVEQLDLISANSRLTVLKSKKGSQSEMASNYSPSSSEPTLNLKSFLGGS